LLVGRAQRFQLLPERGIGLEADEDRMIPEELQHVGHSLRPPDNAGARPLDVGQVLDPSRLHVAAPLPSPSGDWLGPQWSTHAPRPGDYFLVVPVTSTAEDISTAGGSGILCAVIFI